MIRSPRADWAAAWNFTMLFAAASVGLAMAVWQRSPAIFAFTLLAEAIGVFACFGWRRDRIRLLALFSTGYLARLIAASLSWAAENRTGTWIALFATDGQGNFEASNHPLPFGVLTLLRLPVAGIGNSDVVPVTTLLTGVNSPGWLIYNRVLTMIGDRLGGAHPLANVQLQLLAGALVAPILYALAKRVRLRRSGWWASWIIALHPMLIAYSAALIRDELISMLGFLILLFVIEAVQLRRRAVRNWLLVVLGILVLTTLRVASAVYFALISGIFVLAIRNAAGRRMKRVLTFALVVALGIGFTFAVSMPDTASRWAYLKELRLSTADASSSIGLSALQAGGLSWIPAGVVLHFVAPFPFFRQFSNPEAGLLHYWAAVGALANQFLLGFFLIGAAVALARRERMILAAASTAFGFALLSTITFGDPARYMSAHAAPLVALTAVYGFRHVRGVRTIAILGWTSLLVCAHAVYFVVKARYGG